METKYGDEFILRANESGLKGKAVQCARSRNMKLSPWLEEAIKEKVEREKAGGIAVTVVKTATGELEAAFTWKGEKTRKFTRTRSSKRGNDQAAVTSDFLSMVGHCLGANLCPEDYDPTFRPLFTLNEAQQEQRQPSA